MVAYGPLPRSLDTLPGESLASYLLRLSHRLGLSPARLAILTGLVSRDRATIRADSLLHLRPPIVDAFARATRLSTGEVTELCLATLRDRYPALDRNYDDAVLPTAAVARRAGGIPGMARWVFTHSTRYCPQCLAGDGSAIHQAHGGGWQKLWHLPPVFACDTHRRLLLHTCPQCQQTTNPQPRPTPSRLLFAAQRRTGLHPAQCRAAVPAGGTPGKHSECGARLDIQPAADTPRGVQQQRLDRLLALQDRLLTLLRPDEAEHIVTVGRPASVSQYFFDLRLLISLLRVSWPEAQHHAPHWLNTDAVSQHLERQQALASGIAPARGRTRDLLTFDGPPLNADVCANLIAFADDILGMGDETSAHERLQPLLMKVLGRDSWTRHLLATESYCSVGLRAALDDHLRLLRPNRQRDREKTLVLGNVSTRRHRFDHRHIPQMPYEWVDKHFTRSIGISRRLLARITAVVLTDRAEDCGLTAAAELLGIPGGWWAVAETSIRRLISRPGDFAHFTTTMDTIANEVDATPQMVDYQRRRDALSRWAIPLGDWNEIMGQLRRRHWIPITYTHGDWQRRIKSTLIWTRLTQGDYQLAPLVLADKTNDRPRDQFMNAVSQALRDNHTVDLARDTRRTRLTRHLTIYADKLANLIDTGTFNPAYPHLTDWTPLWVDCGLEDAARSQAE